MKNSLKKLVTSISVLSMLVAPTSVFANTNSLPQQKLEQKQIMPRSHDFIVLSDGLNVREKPSASSRVVGWLSKGDIVSYNPEGQSKSGWLPIYGVNSKGVYVEGYVGESYVQNIS